MKSNAKDGIGVTSNKEMIRNTIDKLIPAVKSFEQLVDYLTGIYGWNIRVTDKTVTFTMPDMKQGIRGNKLGDGYGKAELIERIDVAVKEKAALEAKRIAEEKARLEAERKVAAEKAEQRRKEELSQQKRKLLPYFKDLVMRDITPRDVIKIPCNCTFQLTNLFFV